MWFVEIVKSKGGFPAAGTVGMVGTVGTAGTVGSEKKIKIY